jgi:cell division protein FtsB
MTPPPRRSGRAAGPPPRGLRPAVVRGARAPQAAGRAAGSSRPAGVRRPATATAAKRTRAPRPGRFTGRAAVLGMVLLGLLLAYAYPVRVYLAQQAEIAGLEQKQQEQRERIAALSDERAKWDDPEYVKAQAKKELHYVLPGELPFITLPDPAQGGAPATADGSGQRAKSEPWYSKLWSSVGAADGEAPR